MALCTESFSHGWRSMIRLMFQPVRFLFWIKAGLIVFIPVFVQTFIGTIPDITLPDQKTIQQSLDAPSTEIIVQFILFFVVYCVAMLIFLLLQSITSFIILDSAWSGIVSVRKSISTYLSRFITFFIWNTAAGIVMMVGFVITVIIGAIVAFALISSTGNSSIAVFLFCLVALGAFLVFLVLWILYNSALMGLVLPQMLVKDRGILKSWSESFNLIFANFFNFLGFSLIRFVMLMLFGFVYFLTLMIVMIAVIGFTVSFEGGVPQLTTTQNIMMAIISLPIGLFFSFAFLPVTMQLNLYSLQFMALLSSDRDFIPQGEEPSIPIQSTQSDEPELDYATAMAKHQSSPPQHQGPISFSDIPNETEKPATDFNSPDEPHDTLNTDSSITDITDQPEQDESKPEDEPPKPPNFNP